MSTMASTRNARFFIAGVGVLVLALALTVIHSLRADVAPDWLAKRKLFQALQTQVEGGGSPIRTVVVSEPEHYLYVRIVGGVTWSADDGDVRALDGRIRVYQSDDHETRTLVIRHGGGGRIERQLWINGKPVQFDADAQRWESAVLAGMHEPGAS